MHVNWILIFNIAAPIATLVLGALIARYFERRPKLLTHYGYISAFKLRDERQTPVFTHTIVVRNAGNSTATNIVIGHNHLPVNYQIYPPTRHEVRPVADTGDEIYIPALVAKEQITISYLYFPPLTYNDINTYVKSDEGLARVLNAILQPQPPKWLMFIIWTLVFAGAIALIYLFLVGVTYIYS
jgi:hypothetical protein